MSDEARIFILSPPGEFLLPTAGRILSHFRTFKKILERFGCALNDKSQTPEAAWPLVGRSLGEPDKRHIPSQDFTYCRAEKAWNSRPRKDAFYEHEASLDHRSKLGNGQEPSNKQRKTFIGGSLAALLASPLLASPRRVIAKEAELEHSIAIGEPV